MGCFSYLCKKSGKPINSTSFEGDAVHLFLLDKGVVIEHMYGQYDSYGSVFGTTKDKDDGSLTDYTSLKWDTDWQEIVSTHFDGDDTTGIAAILGHLYDGVPPTTISEDDPDQGWGRVKFKRLDKEPYHHKFKTK